DDAAVPLKSWDRHATLEYLNFNIDAVAVDRVTIEATGPTDAQGRTPALRKRYDGQELRAVARLVIDAKGDIVEMTQPVFGATLIIKATDRDTALTPHPIYRVLPNVMTKSPFLISHDAMLGHIRYRFQFRDGIEFALPATGEQRVKLESGIAT